MQFHVLGAQLAQRRDRPRAAVPDAAKPGQLVREPLPEAKIRSWWPRIFLGGGALAAAAGCGLLIFYISGHGIGHSSSAGTTGPSDPIARLITAELPGHRTIQERLPFGPFDQYRQYDTTRAGTARPARISEQVLGALDTRPDKTGLVAAYLARGQLDMAEEALHLAGPGDDLDVERAFVAEKQGHHEDALALLDQVLARTPRHPQALWNRALVLTGLGLPHVAAEAFEASATLVEPGWGDEAKQRARQLRHDADVHAQEWKVASEACSALNRGILPDLGIVRRHASVCRPALNEAVRRAQTPGEVMRLLPVAKVIDGESEDSASSELVERTAAADFRVRGPGVAIYRKLTMTPGLSSADKASLLRQLRASRQPDLMLGAIYRAGLLHDHIDEYVRLARASRDPYYAEIAVEYDAQIKQESGKWLEAEASLREAVARCEKREVELRCTYLQKALASLYVVGQHPTEATRTARAALERSRRLGLYWIERFLFGILADAARFARDDSQLRAYSRESELRDGECPQQRQAHESIADAELAELRFASARSELDRAPTCKEPVTLLRAQIEAELAHVDGTPENIARLREDFERRRQGGKLAPDEQAYLDACEGRLVAAGDPADARRLLARAIAAADQLGIDDATAMKARSSAYDTLLLLGATDLDGSALLALFAAAGRVPTRTSRAGCMLGALLDHERLLLVARDAEGHVQQVFAPHAFETPDFDARTLVPAPLLRTLSSCPRIDVIALPPLYGQPRLLPPALAWSYRGPAGPPTSPAGPPTSPAATGGSPRGRQVALTIEDARPPAALGLAKLEPASHEPRGDDIDEVFVRGDEATPQRVRKELAFADFAEIHAHGFVDLGISDVSLIALSPQGDGSFALTARTIASLELPRAPFIALAACHAAYTAPYQHEPWSLPYAFLLAGARGVLASATEIPDQDAGTFFRAVGDRILHGADPAAVLRDERMRRRADPANWVQDVVLFD